jgi:hypothetical protein
MRPRGEFRALLADAFGSGVTGTTRDLAMRTGIGISATMVTLDNMRRTGEAAVVDTVRIAGVKRPVPVYGRPASASASPAQDWSLITCWAQFPGAASGGVHDR